MSVVRTREDVVPLNDLKAMTEELRPELDGAWHEAVSASA